MDVLFQIVVVLRASAADSLGTGCLDKDIYFALPRVSFVCKELILAITNGLNDCLISHGLSTRAIAGLVIFVLDDARKQHPGLLPTAGLSRLIWILIWG